MGTAPRFREAHPWKRAQKESWTVRTWRGRSLDLAIAAVSTFAANKVGWPGIAVFLAALLGLVIAPMVEIFWRRIRGPLTQVLEENVRLRKRVEQLESAKSGGTLNLKIDASYVHIIEVTEPGDYGFDMEMAWIFFVIRKVDLTNSEDHDIRVVANLRFYLNEPSAVSGLETELDEDRWVLANRPKDYLNTPLEIQSKRGIQGTIAFPMEPIVAVAAGGLGNINTDKIDIEFRDKNTEKSAAKRLRSIRAERQNAYQRLFFRRPAT